MTTDLNDAQAVIAELWLKEEAVEGLLELARVIDAEGHPSEPYENFTPAQAFCIVVNHAGHVADAFAALDGWSFAPEGGWNVEPAE